MSDETGKHIERAFKGLASGIRESIPIKATEYLYRVRAVEELGIELKPGDKFHLSQMIRNYERMAGHPWEKREKHRIDTALNTKPVAYGCRVKAAEMGHPFLEDKGSIPQLLLDYQMITGEPYNGPLKRLIE